VNRGHQTGLDAETVLEQNVNERRKAVRRAARVGNNVVLSRIVFAFVDTHDNGFNFTFAGRRNDYFLRASSEMGFRFFAVGEKAGGLDDDINAERLPRQRGKIFHRADAFNFVTVDNENVVFFERRAALFGGHSVFKFAVDGIILHLVGEIGRVGRHIHDGDDVNRLAEQTLIAQCLKYHPADTTESVDCYFYCHNYLMLFFVGGVIFLKPIGDFIWERATVNQ